MLSVPGGDNLSSSSFWLPTLSIVVDGSSGLNSGVGNQRVIDTLEAERC